MDDVKEKIGQSIFYYRRIAGYTQKELGKKINISGTQIYKYEKGISNISHNMLNTIARALNVSSKQLIASS
jgi:transcriptional regulator with XRE-family HTH domain